MAAALRSAQRAGELTHTLQRLARRGPAGSRAIELNPLVHSLEDLFRRICGERVSLRILLANTAPVVECDQGELEDVLLNLVLSASESSAESNELTISTCDAQQYQGRVGVFASVWVQGNEITTDLTSADDLTKRYGGWTHVERGSSVCLYLPSPTALVSIT